MWVALTGMCFVDNQGRGAACRGAIVSRPRKTLFAPIGPDRVPVYGPVDWNLDQLFTSPVSLDLNNNFAFDDLHSYDDLSNLKFRYQCSPGLAD